MSRSEAAKRAWHTKRAKYGSLGRAKPFRVCTDLVPYGLTAKQYGAIRCWASRHAHEERPATPAQRRNLLRLAAQRRAETHCHRGHRYTALTTGYDARGGWRFCRICRSMSKRLDGRPSWVEDHGVKVSIVAHDRFYARRARQLMAVIQSAHTDHGGTTRRAQRVIATYQKFQAAERAWYQRYDLLPPKRSFAQQAQVCA